MNEKLLKNLDTFLKNNKLKLNSEDFDFITNLNWKSLLPIKCLECGNEFNISMKQLLIPHPPRVGCVCSACYSKELFINKLIEKYGKNPYSFLSQFKDYNSPLKVKCLECGNEWEVKSAKNLLIPSKYNSYPCKKCSNRRNYERNFKELEDALIEKFGVCNYNFISDSFSGKYSKKKITVQCKLCGTTFSVLSQNLLNPKNRKTLL